MNEYNYTQNSVKALQTAEAMAQENSNNFIMPEHLLYALVDQDGGTIQTIFKRLGANCDQILAELNTAIPSSRRWAVSPRYTPPTRPAAPSTPPRRPPSPWATSTSPWSI